jgi:hypothetical protein
MCCGPQQIGELRLLNMRIHQKFTLVFMSIAFALMATSSGASDFKSSPPIPCHIKLIFGINSKGVSVASYVLETQVTNNFAQPIAGVSLHWLDDQENVINNSQAICGDENAPIDPSQTGSCKQTTQEIGEDLLNRLGQKTWTDIINSELKNFERIKQCRVVGYRFEKPNIKTY